MKEYFKKYLENRCSEDELFSFINLFLKEENEKELENNMNEDWLRISVKEKIPDLQPTLHRIHFEMNKLENSRSNLRKMTYYFSRIAAILFIPLMIAFFVTILKKNTNVEMQTISTPLASKTNFELPDGSTVYLNSGSSLSFPRNFNGKNRLVTLNGEAYFDVKKGKHPFEVKTNYMSVKVLGTAFNVMAYGNALPEVTLERGEVVVLSKYDKEKTLKPGDQALVDTANHTIAVHRVETELFTSWRNNQLIFKNEPLGNVVKRLERWYNISVEIEDETLKDKRLNATIEYESISEVMDLLKITLPLNFEYQKDERKLIIKKQ